MITICKQYKMDMPTEMKIVYDVSKNSVSAEYKYEPVYSQYSDKTADDVSQKWLEEERRKCFI